MYRIGAICYNWMEHLYTLIMSVIASVTSSWYLTRSKLKEIEIRTEEQRRVQLLKMELAEEQKLKAGTKPYLRVVDDMNKLSDNFKRLVVDWKVDLAIFSMFSNGQKFVSGTPIYTQNPIFEYCKADRERPEQLKELFDNLRSIENVAIFTELMDNDSFFFTSNPDDLKDSGLKYRIMKLRMKTYLEIMIRDKDERPLASVIFMFADSIGHPPLMIEAAKSWINQQRHLL